MTTKLKKSIISTITFFDLFDYSLTESEIWKFLYSPDLKTGIGLDEIKNLLNGELRNKIHKKNGFYFIPGREEIVNIRHKRHKKSFNKFKKAKRAAKVFSFFPFIKMIAVGNFIPANNTKKNSDIDFFIITKKGQIWLARFFCATISQVLGWRPTEKNKKDKICLTFFISEDNLNLKKLTLDKDIYFYYWLATLSPIYNKDKIYEKFIKENEWTKEYLPNFDIPVIAIDEGLSPSGGQSRVLHKNKLENLARKFQLKIMPKNLKQLANKDTRVVINDKILKFHDQDRREEYRGRFIKRVKNFF